MRNRTRISSLDAFGLRDQRNRIYPALEASDGSTLSLDFTAMGGTLDSRFTFSRSSTATLINSSGLVQYGNHNLFTNTAWLGSTLPTNWALLIGTGTTTWNGDGSVTMTAVTNQRPAINHATITTINPGLPHTFGYLATNVSGSPQIAQIITSSVAGETFAINGVTVASTTVVQSNDLVSCTFTPTTTNVTARLGPGSSSPMSNTSVTASRPQFNVGSSLRPYAANTSTSGSYQAPRFDHDPTTLAPRGLLIEGSATNSLQRSEEFNLSPWSAFSATITANDGVAPDGNTTADSITPSVATGGTFYNSTFAAGTWTFSIWAKANPGSSFNISVDNSSNGRACTYTLTSGGSAGTPFVRGTGGTVTSFSASTQTFQNGWVRCVATVVTTGSNFVAITNPTDTNKILIWGAQLEAGSGASSYIPTGSSTVQRAADSCDMTGSNFSSWFQSGTPYTMLFKYSMNNPADWAGSNVDRGAGLLSASFSNPRVFINAAYRVASGSTDIGRFVRVYDSGTLDMAPSVYPAAASNTALVFAVNTNDAAVYAANQSLGTDASCTLLTGYTDFSIGRVSGSSGYLNGCIRQIKYWPTRLPNATLQSLTQ